MDSFHRYHFIYVQLLERISMFRVMNRQSNCLVRKFCDTEMWFVVEKKTLFMPLIAGRNSPQQASNYVKVAVKSVVI